VLSSDPQRSEALIGRTCVIAAALLWSLSGVITKSLPLEAGPIAFYRSLFAGLALWPLVPRSKWVFHPGLVPFALVFGAMIGLYIAAVKTTTAANAIYLQYTAPFWMIPASIWLLHEWPDRRTVAGIGLAMVGIGLIVLYGHPGGSEGFRGIALGLASGLAYACVAVSLRALRQLDPIWLSIAGNLGGAVALAAWILVQSGSVPLPTAGQGLALLGFGVVQMAVPYALYARGLRSVGAVESGLLCLIEPVLNPVWVALVHGEVPARATLVGGGLLLAGLAARYWPARVSSEPAPV
jgi:drug/metabolite transporter, DME family